MRRDQVLATAAALVTSERAATHGDMENNFATIAAYWKLYLRSRGMPVPNLDAADVAAMMALLKLARAGSNPRHLDNWVDLAGYAACGAEVAKAMG